jgi:hypothetical protein
MHPILKEKILALSESKRIGSAVAEWTLDNIVIAKEPQICLCGHFPIIEICILRNLKNANIAEVGNCCVKRFMNIPSDKIFDGIKRIKKDILRSVNREILDHAHKKGVIDDWQFTFYLDIIRKRKLSDRQQAKKIEINKQILGGMRLS